MMAERYRFACGIGATIFPVLFIYGLVTIPTGKAFNEFPGMVQVTTIAGMLCLAVAGVVCWIIGLERRQ